MLFLIQYDRKQGVIKSMLTFPESQRRNADDARLELELEHHRNCVEYEVVILEAETESALRRTHRRYFEDLASLATFPAIIPK